MEPEPGILDEAIKSAKEPRLWQGQGTIACMSIPAPEAEGPIAEVAPPTVTLSPQLVMLPGQDPGGAACAQLGPASSHVL